MRLVDDDLQDPAVADELLEERPAKFKMTREISDALLQEHADELLEEKRAHERKFYHELFTERSRLGSLECRCPHLRHQLKVEHAALDVRCAQHERHRLDIERRRNIVHQEQQHSQRHAELDALIAPRPDDFAHASGNVYTDPRLRHARIRDIVAHAMPDELAVQLWQFCDECQSDLVVELGRHYRQQEALITAMSDIDVSRRLASLSVSPVASNGGDTDPSTQLDRSAAKVRVLLQHEQSHIEACKRADREMSRIRMIYPHRHVR